MGGRKVFQPATVLTAADVNEFLMDQSVMSFAGTAARGSAIGTATEGMVTYLQDSNSLEFWNGAQWQNVNDNTASVPLNTVTAAGDLIVANGSASVTRLGIGGTNAIPYSTGSALTYLSAGSANQVLSIGTASNLTWTTISGGGGVANKQTFTSSGSWVVPTGVSYVTIVGTGGGCGGGAGISHKNSSNQTTRGGLGGIGGQIQTFFNIPVTAGGTATITIGAGGAGGTAVTVTGTNTNDAGNSGSDGASTTFLVNGLTYTLQGQAQSSTYNSGTNGGAATSTITSLPRYLFAHAARPNPSVLLQNVNTTSREGSGGMTAEQDGLGMTGFVGGNGTGGTGGSLGGNGTNGGLYGGGGNGGGLRSTTATDGGSGNYGGGGGGGNGFAASSVSTGGNGGNGAANTAGGGGGGGASYTNTGASSTGGNGGNGGSGFLIIFW